MSTGTSVQRQVDRARSLRFGMACGAVTNVFLIVVDLAQGPAAAIVPAFLLILFLVLAFVETRVIRTLERAQERELARPRMTAEDYRQLREMEIGLGWEPSEPPASVAELAPGFTPPRAVTLPVTGMTTMADFQRGIARLYADLGPPPWPDCQACGQPLTRVYEQGNRAPVKSYCSRCGRDSGTFTATANLLPGSAALSGSGTLSAPMTGPGGRWRPLSELPEAEAEPGGIPAEPLIERMRRELETPAPGKAAWDDVAYPSEASRHFAQLARVGLEHCLSYCPLCLYRLFGPLPDGVKSDASMWQWLEENWGWKR